MEGIKFNEGTLKAMQIAEVIDKLRDEKIEI